MGKTAGYRVATLADLPTMTEADSDGVFYEVQNPGETGPAIYTWKKTGGLPLLGIIVVSASGIGQWTSSVRTHFANIEPTVSPPFDGITWVASLTNPQRVVQFYSSAGGWIKISASPAIGNISPLYNFTGDLPGQIYMDTLAGATYIMDSVNSKWFSISTTQLK